MQYLKTPDVLYIYRSLMGLKLKRLKGLNKT